MANRASNLRPSQINHVCGEAVVSFLNRSELRLLTRALKAAPEALASAAARPTPLKLIVDSTKAAAVRWLQSTVADAGILPDGFVPTRATSAVLVPSACGLASVSVFRGDATTWVDVLDEAESWAAMRTAAATEGDEIAPDAGLWRVMHDLGVAESASAQVFPSYSL
jgi:hypothetical protein